MAEGDTGYLFDARYLDHETGEVHYSLPGGGELETVEHPSAMRITRRSHALIAGSGLLDRLTLLEAQPATPDDVALYHTREHIARVRDICAAGGGETSTEEGESTPAAPESYDVALLGVGGGMAAVDAVMAGRVRNAYALVRPPGHHATANAAMGFCIFNNVVIAARHAQRSHGLRRVMIVDWDVHHGNGTESAFYSDPDVLFVSLHQEDWYPKGRGKATDVGTGEAEGRTVNIPLPPGTGDRGYLEVVERVIVPIARQFGPELLLISAGQDPSMMDPLGRMMVTMQGFRGMATLLRELAGEVCDGRLVAVQEGGYSAAYVPFCTVAAIEGLLGQSIGLRDPYAGSSELDRSQHEYRPQQTAAIEAVIAAQQPFWRLS